MPLVLPSLANAQPSPEPLVSQGFAQRIQKLQLLKEHYDIAGDGQGGWAALAMALAIDHVPGFRVVYDDPLAALMGLPISSKNGNLGGGQLPDFWGSRLLAMVEAGRHLGIKSDAAVCEMMVRAGRPDLDGKRGPDGKLKPEADQKRERNRLVATLRRRLAEAKIDAYGKMSRSKHH